MVTEIENMLKKVGFVVHVTDGPNTLPGTLSGIIFECGEPVPEIAKLLGHAFTEANIAFSFARGPWPSGTPDAFRIVVWP